MEAGLERWLQIWGFEANPFAYREAGSDPYLSRYFVAPDYFDEVLGDPDRPQTAVVFAPRGGGKTALRVMVEYHCRERLMKKPVLSASYTDFSRVLDAVGYDLAYITPRLHAYEILNCIVTALAEWLVEHLDALNSLDESEKAHLEWYLSYFGDYITPKQADILIHGGVKFRHSQGRRPLGFVKAAQHGTPAYLERTLDERYALPPAQLLDELSGLIQALGFNAIYILVDRVDEIPFTAASPEAMLQLLEPLMAYLTLMNLRRAAFKFFLPDELEEAILAIPSIRPDRLMIRKVKWTDEALLKVLHRRLEAFNDYSSLDELCVPELRGRIEREMVALAKESPRNLVRLGELLFSEQARLTENDRAPEISERAWEVAKQRFFEEKKYEWEFRTRQYAPDDATQGAEESPAEILEFVCAGFPAPIAMVCRAFLTERAPERRFKRMLDLFEVTMFFSVYLLIGTYRYLAGEGQTALKPAGSVLREVKGELTLGKLNALLKRLIGSLVQQEKVGKLPRLFQRFRNNNSAVIDHFIDLRNRFAHGGLQDGSAYEELLQDCEPRLIEMFRDLLFLTETRLIWVDNIKKLREGNNIHISRLCMGDNPIFRWWEFDAPVTLDCEKLWIISGENFAQAIPLHPLIIMARCEECRQEEIFFYSKYEKGNAVYTNYLSGHRLTTARYLAEFAETLGRK